MRLFDLLNFDPFREGATVSWMFYMYEGSWSLAHFQKRGVGQPSFIFWLVFGDPSPQSSVPDCSCGIGRFLKTRCGEERLIFEVVPSSCGRRWVSENPRLSHFLSLALDPVDFLFLTTTLSSFLLLLSILTLYVWLWCDDGGW